MVETRWHEWVIAAFLALALVGLIAYARGDDSDTGRSPERDGVVVVVR